MRIDPKVERATREMLGHAIRAELRELTTVSRAVGEQTYHQCLALCALAAGYLAIDVCKKWPTDAEVRELARNATEAEHRLELSEADFYDYLSGSALGAGPLAQPQGAAGATATLPVLLTGSLLQTFHPRDRKWWDYLDKIESATEAAERIDLYVLPALMLRSRREQPR